MLLLSFQFSDMLLYTSKGVTATNQFKVHGQLPLHGMIVSIMSSSSPLVPSVPHQSCKDPTSALGSLSEGEMCRLVCSVLMRGEGLWSPNFACLCFTPGCSS